MSARETEGHRVRVGQQYSRSGREHSMRDADGNTLGEAEEPLRQQVRQTVREHLTQRVNRGLRTGVSECDYAQ